MLLAGAGYQGEVVVGDPADFLFNTLNQSTGAPTSGFTGAGGTGSPSYRWRNITSGTTGTSGITSSENILAGVHSVRLDTASLDKNTDYAIEVIVGEVDTVSVANAVVGTFSCSGKAAGRVYEQSVKCDAGIVTNSAGASRTFDITGSDINGDTDNYYRAQVLKFSPGANNKNIGRTILKSQPLGSNTCRITLQRDLPNPVSNNDPCVILPEERELAIYTCNITVEFGASNNQGDKYSIEWFANGEPMQNADTILSTMGFAAFRWSNDVAVFPEQSWPGGDVNWSPNAALFKYTSTQLAAIPPNEGVTMKATGLIDDIPYQFSRTLFNYD